MTRHHARRSAAVLAAGAMLLAGCTAEPAGSAYPQPGTDDVNPAPIAGATAGASPRWNRTAIPPL